MDECSRSTDLTKQVVAREREVLRVLQLSCAYMQDLQAGWENLEGYVVPCALEEVQRMLALLPKEAG